MPNHICNIVKVKGDLEEVKNFMESVAKEKAQYKNEATGYGTIDFNKVIPEPEYKNNTHPGCCILSNPVQRPLLL